MYFARRDERDRSLGGVRGAISPEDELDRHPAIHVIPQAGGTPLPDFMTVDKWNARAGRSRRNAFARLQVGLALLTGHSWLAPRC